MSCVYHDLSDSANSSGRSDVAHARAEEQTVSFSPYQPVTLFDASTVSKPSQRRRSRHKGSSSRGNHAFTRKRAVSETPSYMLYNTKCSQQKRPLEMKGTEPKIQHTDTKRKTSDNNFGSSCLAADRLGRLTSCRKAKALEDLQDVVLRHRFLQDLREKMRRVLPKEAKNAYSREHCSLFTELSILQLIRSNCDDGSLLIGILGRLDHASSTFSIENWHQHVHLDSAVSQALRTSKEDSQR